MAAQHADRSIPIQHTRAILIATTDEGLCESLRTVLSEKYDAFIRSRSGIEALDKVKHQEPALLIVDSRDGGLEDMDGFELSAMLHAFPDDLRLPVLLVLADDTDASIERAYQCGATDYFALPLRPVVVKHRTQMALQIQLMQGTLSETEQRYRIISTSISDYAYAYRVTEDGRLIKEWNTKAFETITGYNPSDLSGDGWSVLIHPDDYDITIQRFERLMRGEKDVSEFRIITSDGTVKWLRDYGQPVLDEFTGRVTMIYGAAQDISERRQTEEMLRAKALALQERNEELDAFAHTVAHDLKNPISSMMGFASLVLNYFDRMTDDKIQEYLGLIMESGYKLKDIINSLLLLAGVNRMESVSIEPLDMQAIVDGAKSRMIPMIDEQGAQILEPDTWPVALGFAPWVEEVWANYLSNALKYGGKPPRIRFGADSPSNGKVRFWIEDNGTGLSPEDQRRVFTPFTRLSQAKIEGHGLGLSVVHRIVEKLGGEVGVSGEVGQGSVFSFTLPSA